MTSITGYNIVILPSEEIKTQAIQWSEELTKKFPSKFTLDGKMYHPHMTLYQSNFPDENYASVVKALSKIAATTQPFSIAFNEIKPFVDFIFYHAQNNASLQSLHERIVDSLNPLRDPDFSIPEDLTNGFPSNFAENIHRYGYALAKTDYLPHITLSRISTTEAQILPPKHLEMQVHACYLTNVDHDGTCTKILEKFEL